MGKAKKRVNGKSGKRESEASGLGWLRYSLTPRTLRLREGGFNLRAHTSFRALAALCAVACFAVVSVFVPLSPNTQSHSSPFATRHPLGDHPHAGPHANPEGHEYQQGHAGEEGGFHGRGNEYQQGYRDEHGHEHGGGPIPDPDHELELVKEDIVVELKKEQNAPHAGLVEQLFVMYDHVLQLEQSHQDFHDTVGEAGIPEGHEIHVNSLEMEKLIDDIYRRLDDIFNALHDTITEELYVLILQYFQMRRGKREAEIGAEGIALQIFQDCTSAMRDLFSLEQAYHESHTALQVYDTEGGRDGLKGATEDRLNDYHEFDQRSGHWIEENCYGIEQHVKGELKEHVASVITIVKEVKFERADGLKRSYPDPTKTYSANTLRDQTHKVEEKAELLQTLQHEISAHLGHLANEELQKGGYEAEEREEGTDAGHHHGQYGDTGRPEAEPHYDQFQAKGGGDQPQRRGGGDQFEKKGGDEFAEDEEP